MRLVERGVLDLDRPLHEYLPFPNIEGDTRSKELTARLVLSHQTGLPNWAFGGPGGWERGDPLTLEFDPGARFGYSGEGFNYLARVVEKVVGKKIGEILEEEVSAPTGMQSAYFERSPELIERVSTGHFFRSATTALPIPRVSVRRACTPRPVTSRTSSSR